MSGQTQTALDACIERQSPRGRDICRAMAEALEKIGFDCADLPATPQYEKADFGLITDPYSREVNLTGYWYDGHRHKIGHIQFLGDGSFYAEFDVVKPHPRKKQWFVEAITAWGRDGQIKTEPKLLPALS